MDDAVVDVPQPRGHEVSNDDIDGVVTPGCHQHRHAPHSHAPKHPVKQPELLRGV